MADENRAAFFDALARLQEANLRASSAASDLLRLVEAIVSDKQDPSPSALSRLKEAARRAYAANAECRDTYDALRPDGEI